jgi:hypothetical protein
MRFQFLHTETDSTGVEYAYVLDLESGETLKSPIVEKKPEPAKPVVRSLVDVIKSAEGQPSETLDVHSAGTIFGGTKVPPMQYVNHDEPEVEEKPSVKIEERLESDPPQYVNRFAKPNPTYAWEDPDWVDPIERKRRAAAQRLVSPTIGADITKVFREPGKFGENEIDHVPGSGR